MIKSILQFIANKYVYMLQNANSIEDADKFYEMGLNFDSFCITHFKIYLS